jgi:hypothetical protein
MKKKLKELCSLFPKQTRIQSSLDNVATKLFHAVRYRQYIQSTITPERRYGVDVDKSLLKHHNEYLEDFDTKYGPNEQYLINKTLYSPYTLIYIIGGIGVGKTSFTHFLITAVMKELRHVGNLDQTRCPCPIYVDFLEAGQESFLNKSPEEVQEIFSVILCDRIENELSTKNYFNLEQEVGTVWEHIIANEGSGYQKNPALSYIITRIREEEAGSDELISSYTETIGKRKKIRREIKEGKNLRRLYLSALLKYIKSTFYENHPGCFLLIVDNIDREPILVQQAVKLILKPFSRTSGIRTIVTARQTTFFQTLYDDGLSEPIDQVPYCGPTPLSILVGRINEFLSNPEEYKDFYTPDALPSLIKGVQHIRDEFLRRDAFTSFFLAFTGRSVRKALLLGQNLIHNSVYDPYEIGKDINNSSLSQRDIHRAIIVGPNITYTWTEGGLIENVFQVHDPAGDSYFVKLRILRILLKQMDLGIKIKTLIFALSGFDYRMDEILDAINEMLKKPKRLIWSDSVREFDSIEDMLKHGNSHLFISSIGEGYAKYLYKDVAYIQEVMLDTEVDPSDFGRGWDYGRMEDRLRLISSFCDMLFSHDKIEVQNFIGKKSTDDYVKYFGTRTLISKEILESVQHGVLPLLQFVHTHSNKYNPFFEEFMESQKKFYVDRLITASRLEGELLTG